MTYTVQGKRQTLSSQALTYAVASTASQVLVSIAYLLTARQSDPAQFGATVSAIAVGTALAVIVDFGENSYWTRQLANGRLTAAGLSSQAGGKLLVAVGVAVVLGSVGILLGSGYWVASPLAIGIVGSQMIIVPLRALQLPVRVLTTTMVVDKGVCLGVLLAAIHMGTAASSALWFAILSGSLFGMIVAMRLTPRPARIRLWAHRPSFPWRQFAVFRHIWSSQRTPRIRYQHHREGSWSGCCGRLRGGLAVETQPLTLFAGAFASAVTPVAAAESNVLAAWRQLARAASALSQPVVAFLQARGLDRTVARVMVVVVAMQLIVLVPASMWLGAAGGAYTALAAQLVLVVALSCILWMLVRSSGASVPAQER